MSSSWPTGGFTLYNVNAADNLHYSNFPSGIGRDSVITVGEARSIENGLPIQMFWEGDYGSSLNPRSMSYRVLSGSVEVLQPVEGTITFGSVQNPTFYIPLTYSDLAALPSDSEGYFYVQFYDLENAVFANGTDSCTVRAHLDQVFMPQIAAYECTVTAAGKTSTNTDPLGRFDRYAWRDMRGTIGGNYTEYMTNSGRYNVGLNTPVGECTRNTVTVQSPANLHEGEYEVTLDVSSAFYMPVDIQGGVWTEYPYSDGRHTFKDVLWPLEIDEGHAVSLSQSVFNRAEVHYNYEIEKNGISEKLFDEMQVLSPRPMVKNSVITMQAQESSVEQIAQGQQDTYALTLTTSMGYQYYYSDTRHDQGEVAWQPYVEEAVTLTMQERTTAATAVLSTPDNVTFTSGHQIPIVAEFDFPVRPTEENTITVNGQELKPAEVGATTFRLSYLYTVPEDGNATLFLEDEKLTGIQGANSRNLTVTLENEAGNAYGQSGGLPLNYDGDPEGGAQVEIPRLIDVLGEWEADVGELEYDEQTQTTVARVELTMPLPKEENFRNLLLDGFYEDDETGELYCGLLAASRDGGKTLLPVKLDDNDKPTELTVQVAVDAAELLNKSLFVVEFYETTRGEDGTLTPDPYPIWDSYAAFSVDAPIPLTAEKIDVSLCKDWPEEDETVFIHSAPELTLEADVEAGDYTWSQIEWYTDNEQVARITDASKNADTAELALLGTGTVNIYVRAVNGNLSAYRDGTEDAPYEDDGIYSKKVATLTVGEGDAPYLRIPEDEITVRSGDDVTLRWAGNLVQKNMQYSGDKAATAFTIEVFEGGLDKDGQPAGELLNTVEFTYDPARPSPAPTSPCGAARGRA